METLTSSTRYNIITSRNLRAVVLALMNPSPTSNEHSPSVPHSTSSRPRSLKRIHVPESEDGFDMSDEFVRELKDSFEETSDQDRMIGAEAKNTNPFIHRICTAIINTAYAVTTSSSRSREIFWDLCGDVA